MSEPSVMIRAAETDDERTAALNIRKVVFVDEQQVPAELEPDAYDADALHLIALAPAGYIVGTARIVDRGGGIAKIGRVAVLRRCRGQGVGAALMRAALNAAQEHGQTVALLDAQIAVIPFYERLGFVAEGPVFDDAGIDHRRMRRSLEPYGSGLAPSGWTAPSLAATDVTDLA